MSDKVFNSELKNIRESKSISIYKMAKDLDINWHTLDNLEKGNSERISLSVLKKICSYLNTSLDKIIDFNFEKKMKKVS